MPKQSPNEPEAIAPGTVVDGRYKVVRAIGQGGNGLVYEVEHMRTGRKLALKALLDETGFARLEQEARAASLMKNGHTARIVDMEAGGPAGAYMVMELLEGQSLRALLDEAGQLPLELTSNIAMSVCECLHEAHGLGIIHRDLKPENIFLCASPWPGQYDVKVLDFGVMTIAAGGGAIPKSSLTRTGSTVGTPYYMSLEQLRNSSAVDVRADVYSLGVVLYECLSGRKPFQADTIGDLVYALCSGPPTQLARVRPDLPSDMAEVVMRTLSANRDDRPATMLDLAVALLPHANPAFGLWVKIDGKQPALSRAGLADPHSPYARPTAVPALASSGAVALPPAGPITQAPPPPSVVRPLPPRPAAGILPTESPTSAFADLHPAPPDLGPAPSERRDTPTEMYVKGEHGSPDLDEPGPAPGDRDTPTRAYNLEGLVRPPLLATLQSPTGLVDPEDDVPDVATIDLPDGPGPLLFRDGPAPAPTESGPGPALQPGSPGVKMTIPLGEFMRNLPAPPSAPPSALPLRPKPRWQASVDAALIRVVRAGEHQLKRFHEAPQNTQIIVVIVVGTLVILLLGFVLFLTLH